MRQLVVPTAATEYAECAVLLLLGCGATADEIREHFTRPDTAADQAFERTQIAHHGQVIAPAAAVKAEMRRLVAARTAGTC